MTRDEKVVKVARALCLDHYCKRFTNAEPGDAVIDRNVDANWHIFKPQAEIAVRALEE